MREKEPDELIDVAFRRLRRVGNDPSRLPDLERTVVSVTTAQGIIDNGGFQYFFEMDFPNRPLYRVFTDAYRAVGATRAAERIDQAVAMFPFRAPHLSQKRRNAFMDSLGEAHAFFRLGDQVCGDTSVWEQLRGYVALHQRDLATPPGRRLHTTGTRR